MTNTEKSTEKLEIIKLFYQEYEYKHKTYWELIYKSVFSIITVMTLPYILIGASRLETYVFIFPIIGAMLCVFSAFILYSEGLRMSAMKIGLKRLLEKLDAEYKEVSITTICNSKMPKFLIKMQIKNTVLLLYLVLFIGNIIECHLITTGKFI